MSIFASDKNVTNREILNSLNSINNKLKNLIEVNNNETKIKYKKVENNAKMMENEYRELKYKDEENNNENEVEHKIIMILD